MLGLDLLGATPGPVGGPRPCLAGFAAGGCSPPRNVRVGDDMKTAFAVSHDINKGLGGVLNAVYPGVGTAATGITNMWLDPLQGELTKTPTQSAPVAGRGGMAGGAAGEAQIKKAAAEKAAAEAMIANQKAIALTVDAKAAADRADGATKTKKRGMSVGAKAAIGAGAVSAVLAAVYAVLRVRRARAA